MRKFLTWIGYLLPRDDEEDQQGGDPTQAPGGEPAQGSEEREALNQAADLEAANARIRELEAQDQDRIRQEAENLLLEVMPEYGEERLQAVAPPMQGYQQGPPYGYQQQYGMPPAQGYEQDEEEVSPEDRLRSEMQQTQQQVMQMQDQMFARELEARLDRAQQNYPRMDRFRVMTYLANAGDAADRMNIEKLCEISHNKESRRLQEYAEGYHTEQLAAMRSGNNPPPVPGAGAGTPTQGQKVTTSNAARVLSERLAARGFGR